MHGGKDGFRLFPDAAESGGGVCNTCGSFSDGFALLQWAKGRGFLEVLSDVAEHVGLVSGHASGRNGTGVPSAGRSMRDLVERLWREAMPDPEPIGRYLRARGLAGDAIPPSLRYHPELAYFDETGRRMGDFPGIVARVESVHGDLVGVHRIYLDPAGHEKADVSSPKKLLAVHERATGGAAIRLAAAGEVLAITEGIETGLAVLQATGTPVWVAISAGGMEDVELPSTLRRLELWADHDANGRGQRAAEIRAALAAAAGLEVAIILPHEPGDWLDVLQVHGEPVLVTARRAAPPWTPPHRSPAPATPDRPAIDAGDEDLPRVAAVAWAALLGANVPAVVFRHGGWPAWIEHDDHGIPVIRPLTPDRLRHRLARVADWYRVRRQERGPAEPRDSVVRDMLARPDPPLPILARLVEAPVFAADGTLHMVPGYHVAGQTYYEPAPGFIVPAVPERPTAADVAEARRWLVEELLEDFPFTGDAERAHAIALLLLPFARALVDGSTPFHLIEKPAPGTGASLLASMLLYPALGHPVATLTEPRDEDEARKRLTSALRAGRSVVLIDNLRRRLESAALCAAITAPVWEDRVLGASEMGRWPVTCVWIGTGNNPALSDELARRTVRIRLDALEDRPWLRTGFRHSDLRAWAAAHRGALVHAALVLIQAWLVAGRPATDATLGMFESWAGTMGGILAVAGIPGFLGNLDAFYQETDEEGTQVRGFLAGWWARHQDRDVTVTELYDLAAAADSPLDLDAKTEHGRRIKLGKLLGRLRDRRYRLDDGRTVRIGRGEKVHQAVAWRLQDTGEHSPNSPTSPSREYPGEYGSVGEYPPPLLYSRAGARAGTGVGHTPRNSHTPRLRPCRGVRLLGVHAVTLPLAAASERLRRRPGRPRKFPEPDHQADRQVDQHAPRGGQQERRAVAPPALVLPAVARLLDLDGAGRYCGVSVWTLKAWLRSGILRRVPMPARVLRVDREDLDRLIAQWKHGAR